ncbi:hypothetical protein SMICM304S_04813 [Streptomyces microflavus]
MASSSTVSAVMPAGPRRRESLRRNSSWGSVGITVRPVSRSGAVSAPSQAPGSTTVNPVPPSVSRTQRQVAASRSRSYAEVSSPHGSGGTSTWPSGA